MSRLVGSDLDLEERLLDIDRELLALLDALGNGMLRSNPTPLCDDTPYHLACIGEALVRESKKIKEVLIRKARR